MRQFFFSKQKKCRSQIGSELVFWTRTPIFSKVYKMAWNPSQYLKFLSPRLKPALHLLEESSILLNSQNKSPAVESVKRVLDLGCGPGNLTKYLCEKFPKAHVHGVDSSQEMVQRAIQDNMGLSANFRCRSIEEESFQTINKYDLVYSNAALHWCINHEELLPRIISNLVSSDGGVFAFQIPDTRNQPSHVLMDVAAVRSGLTDKLQNVRIPRMDHSADWYYHLLRPHVQSIHIWTTEYVNPLAVITGVQWHPVLQFVESTGLKPLVDALDGPSSGDGKLFLQTYNSLLHEAYPVVTVGSEQSTLLTYRRFFLVCQK